MNIVTKLTVSFLVGLAIFPTNASADIQKGQKIYLKKLKVKCGFSAAKFAHMHTQDEWKAIKETGKFGEEVMKICSKATLKPTYENDVYDFAYEYAKDSGNVPSY